MDASVSNDRKLMLERALTPERVRILEVSSKEEALLDMIDALATCERVQDKEALTTAIFKREAIMSTGIGLGLAVPHVRIASVSQLVMAVGLSRPGIADYVSLDDKPVHVIFMIAAPEGQHVEYLRLLSAISSRAKALEGSLQDAPDAGALYELLVHGEFQGDAPATAAV